MLNFRNKINESLIQLSQSRHIYLWLFALAVITRTIGAVAGGDRANDEGTYHYMAQAFLDGRGLLLDGTTWGTVYSWLPPGFALLKIPFLWAFNDYAIPLAAFFILMSGLAHVLLFPLAKRLLPPNWALLAAVIWIIYPPQWFWGSRSNPHTFATNMTVICLLLLFIAWEKKSYLLALGIGFLWAMTSLMRGEYVLGLVPLAMGTVWAFKGSRKGILISTVMLAGQVLGLAPWVIRNYNLHHEFVLISTNFGDGFYQTFRPDFHFKGDTLPIPADLHHRLMQEPNEVIRARLLKEEAINELKKNPVHLARVLGMNFINYWRPWLSPTAATLPENLVYVVSYGPIFILFLISLLYVPWKEPHWTAVWLFLLYQIGIRMPFYVIVRYRETMMPLYILLATLALSCLLDRTTKKQTMY